MIILGALVNGIAVLIGSTIGLFLKKGLPDSIKNSLMQGLGLCVLFIGISGLLVGKNITVTIVSITIGIILGEIIDIDKRLNSLGDKLQSIFSNSSSGSNFAEGFVSCTLIICVGAMAIVGSIQSGLTGNNETLFAKSLIDAVVVLVMSSTLGVGVCFSGFVVFAYEALLTLMASFVSPFLTTSVINEMTAVGSLLIIGIALNMMEITKIKVANFLLAPFLPIVILWFM
jgi:uncharacterized membrane protein YqgA involved in biofilm formation